MTEPTRTPPSAGIYYGMPRAEYEAIDAINWSSLKRMGESPEMYRAKADLPDEEDDRYIVGTMCGEFVEFPEASALKYITTPAAYPKLRKLAPCTVTENGESATVEQGRGSAKDTWEVALSVSDDGVAMMSCPSPAGLAELVEPMLQPWNGNATFCRQWAESMTAAGKHIISRSDLHDATEMARRIRELPSAAKVLDGGQCEAVVVWQDAHTGLWCKGAVDVLKWPIFGEIKTTRRSVAIPSFAGVCKSLGYFGQIAFYMDGLIANLGRPENPDVAPIARVLAVSNEYPYSAAYLDVIDMPGCESNAYLLYGRALYLGYLIEVKQCMEQNHWPGPNREGPGQEPGGEFLVPEWLKLDLPDWMMV